jgi:hypothetical protein
MYTLLPLFSLTAWWFLVRYLRHGGARDFGLSMAATAAALYTHNFAVYVPVVHVVLVLVSGQISRRFRMWVLAVGVLLLAYAPWIPTLLDQVANRYHYAWYLPLWKEYGLLGAAFNTLKSFSPAGSFIIYENVGALEWYGVPAIVSTSFAVWGAIVLARKRGEIGLLGVVWLPAACVVPMAAAFAVSSILTPHYVPGRVDQMMFPCFALLAAAGLAALDPAWLRRAIVPMCLAVAIIGKGSLYPDYREYGFDGTDADLAESVLGELRPGDVVLCTSLTRASLEYYLRRAGADVPIFSFPRTTARHLGAQVLLVLVVLAKNQLWWGGSGFGPRYLCEALTALALAIAWLWPRMATRPVLRAGFAACVALGVAVQVIGAFTTPCGWHDDPVVVDRDPSRLWDWRDPQLLRCLRAGPRQFEFLASSSD